MSSQDTASIIKQLKEASETDIAFRACLQGLARTQADRKKTGTLEWATAQIGTAVDRLAVVLADRNKRGLEPRLELSEEMIRNISGTEEFQKAFGGGRKVGV